MTEMLSSLQGLSLQCGSDSSGDEAQRGEGYSNNENSNSKNISKQVHGSRTEFIKNTAVAIADKMQQGAGDWEHAKFLLTNYMQEFSDEYDKCEYGAGSSEKEKNLKLLKKAVVMLYQDN